MAEPKEPRVPLGMLVRQIWVRWAREQPNPKLSWLLSWDEISDADREVDMRIGETLFRKGHEAGRQSVLQGGVVVPRGWLEPVRHALANHDWAATGHWNDVFVAVRDTLIAWDALLAGSTPENGDEK